MQIPNWGKVLEEYHDIEESGKNTDRPGFHKLIEDIKLGKINAVICKDISRISRNRRDFCNLWEFLKERNVAFFSLNQNFDTSTIEGEMMIFNYINLVHWERESIVKRIVDGSRARARRGLFNGGRRPLGYDPHPEKRNHLMVNEKEAPLVRLIFEKYLELGSISALRVWLN